MAAVFQWETLQVLYSLQLVTLLSCSAFAWGKMVKKEKEEEEEAAAVAVAARVPGCSHVHQPTSVTHLLSHHLSVLSA